MRLGGYARGVPRGTKSKQVQGKARAGRVSRASASGRSGAARYTPAEFVRLTGVPQRRLRSWATAGLLPPPEGRGRAARYLDTHVLLARAIQGLRARGVKPRDIKLQLARLNQQQLRALADAPLGPRPDGTSRPQAANPPPAPTYPSTDWQVVQLGPGLMLLVSPSTSPVAARVADEIYRHYASAPSSS